MNIPLKTNHGVNKVLQTALLLLLLVSLPLSALQVEAKELTNPAFSYGESLTAEEKERTEALLGVSSVADQHLVAISELNGLLRNNVNYDQVYSSVYIMPGADGQGVKVDIVTPATITRITEAQYQNAAITAGAVNVTLRIASVKAVDGSGALAGVYKAFQEAGFTLSEDNVAVAQEELQETSDIHEEHDGKEGYSDDLLNAAIADMKAQIQQYKEDHGGVITDTVIINIVNNVINNYNLQDILSEENIERLVNLMKKFSELEFTDAQKEAIKEFGQNLIKEGGNLLDNVKSTWEDLDENVKTGITGFFRSLFEAIGKFFKGLFN